MQFIDWIPVENGKAGKIGVGKGKHFLTFQLQTGRFATQHQTIHAMVDLQNLQHENNRIVRLQTPKSLFCRQPKTYGAGHLGRLDVGPHDCGQKLKRSDHRKHHLKNEHACVDIKVLHQAGDCDGVQKVGAEQIFPEHVRANQFALGQVVLGQNVGQLSGVRLLSMDVQAHLALHLVELESDVVRDEGEQQRQKADDAAEQVREVDHLNALWNEKHQIDGAVFSARVQELVRQVGGERSTKVRYDVVEHATRAIHESDQNHLATHFAVSTAKKTIGVQLQMFGDLQPVLQVRPIVETMAVEVRVGQHAVKAYPHPQEDGTHLVEEQRKVGHVRLVRRAAIDEEQGDAVDHDAERNPLHQFGLTIHFVVRTNSQATIFKAAVQQAHLLKQTDQ